MGEIVCGYFLRRDNYTEVVVSCEKNGSARTHQTTLKARSCFLRYSALQLTLCMNYSKVVVLCEYHD